MQQTYLSFDCATKTFAFCVCRVSPPILNSAPALRARLTAARALAARAAAAAAAGDAAAAERLAAAAAAAAAALDRETAAAVELVDGDVVDLAPGRADADVSTIERIQALAKYIAARVRPALAAALAQELALAPPPSQSQSPLIVIEYQMGPNARARAIAAALVAFFAAERVVIVGPSLKNRVSVSAEGQYGHFLQRYSNSYGANKAHALFNFAALERVFGSGIPPTPPARRGHIADSCMQVLGFVLHGADEKDAARMF